MDETQSDIAERELSEAATIDRESRDDEGEDRLSDLLAKFHETADRCEESGKAAVESLTRVFGTTNGYDATTEEVEDERDCELN